MARKTFNQKLAHAGDLPKIEDQSARPNFVERYGGPALYIAAPMQYHELMARVPLGKVITVDRLRAWLADRAGADVTCPLTAGIFTNIAAHASVEREHDPDTDIADLGGAIPWWRTLRTKGELNPKYPGGIEEQQHLLEAEGHQIELRGKRAFVVDYEDSLWDIA